MLRVRDDVGGCGVAAFEKIDENSLIRALVEYLL